MQSRNKPESRLSYGGHDYIRNSTYKLASGENAYSYLCVKGQSKNCRGRLKVKHDGRRGFTFEETVEHTCPPTQLATGHRVINIKEEMKAFARAVALEHVSRSPNQIYDETMNHLRITHPNAAYSTISKNEILNHIKNSRREVFENLGLSIIEKNPLLTISEQDDRPFLQFNSLICLNGNMERIVGWAHPSLLRYLKTAHVDLFIDATFRICPVGFYQCLIIMCYDPPSRLYIPVYYILMTKKTEWSYWNIIAYLPFADIPSSTFLCAT